MTDAVLIFTFSPVQSFIAEARRAPDLYAGSRILIELANSAIEHIQNECGVEALIYPVRRSGDTPNKIVARVRSDRARSIGEGAKDALLKRWAKIADGRLAEIRRRGFPWDSVWERIWKRQTGRNYFWGVYWAAAMMEREDDYAEAYRRASDALDAVKRSRVFIQPETGEPNLKDSLSGKREALHIANEDAKKYWANVAAKVKAPEIRPEGRERLDAIGTIKRFGPIADRRTFFSVSTVAAEDFLQTAKEVAPHELARHREAVEQLLGHPNRVRNEADWPYDGDLLFAETFSGERLKDSYHVTPLDIARLKLAQDTLRVLHKTVERPPSPYYAIVILDGDSMGEWLSACGSEVEHREVSARLAAFADKVNDFVRDGFRIYNGGDDVLALAPLARAVPLAQQMAGEFNRITEARTASAGIAIAHHLYPLDAALEAARAAEGDAKRVNGKAAVAMRVIKHNGEAVTMRSKWVNIAGLFDELVGHFAEKRLSSRFAYDLAEQAEIVIALPDGPRTAILKRLVERHKSVQMTDSRGLVERLSQWGQSLDKQMPAEKLDDQEILQGFAELSRWVVFARFVAQGGGE